MVNLYSLLKSINIPMQCFLFAISLVRCAIHKFNASAPYLAGMLNISLDLSVICAALISWV